MGKKIVVITSSFRKDGNSTALAEAFIEEAQKKGHSVKRFDAAYLNIGPCHGCDTCFKTGKACTFDDDFNTVAPYIEEADAVILATPTYWFSIPGKVKCLIDKLYSFCVGKKEAIAGKKAGLLCTCRSQSTSDMEGIIMADEQYFYHGNEIPSYARKCRINAGSRILPVHAGKTRNGITWHNFSPLSSKSSSILGDSYY